MYTVLHRILNFFHKLEFGYIYIYYIEFLSDIYGFIPPKKIIEPPLLQSWNFVLLIACEMVKVG